MGNGHQRCESPQVTQSRRVTPPRLPSGSLSVVAAPPGPPTATLRQALCLVLSAYSKLADGQAHRLRRKLTCAARPRARFTATSADTDRGARHDRRQSAAVSEPRRGRARGGNNPDKRPHNSGLCCSRCYNDRERYATLEGLVNQRPRLAHHLPYTPAPASLEGSPIRFVKHRINCFRFRMPHGSHLQTSDNGGNYSAESAFAAAAPDRSHRSNVSRHHALSCLLRAPASVSPSARVIPLCRRSHRPAARTPGHQVLAGRAPRRGRRRFVVSVTAPTHHGRADVMRGVT